MLYPRTCLPTYLPVVQCYTLMYVTQWEQRKTRIDLISKQSRERERVRIKAGVVHSIIDWPEKLAIPIVSSCPSSSHGSQCLFVLSIFSLPSALSRNYNYGLRNYCIWSCFPRNKTNPKLLWPLWVNLACSGTNRKLKRPSTSETLCGIWRSKKSEIIFGGESASSNSSVCWSPRLCSIV